MKHRLPKRIYVGNWDPFDIMHIQSIKILIWKFTLHIHKRRKIHIFPFSLWFTVPRYVQKYSKALNIKGRRMLNIVRDLFWKGSNDLLYRKWRIWQYFLHSKPDPNLFKSLPRRTVDFCIDSPFTKDSSRLESRSRFKLGSKLVNSTGILLKRDSAGFTQTDPQDQFAGQQCVIESANYDFGWFVETFGFNFLTERNCEIVHHSKETLGQRLSNRGNTTDSWYNFERIKGN